MPCMHCRTDSGFACFIPRLRDPLFQGSSDTLEHVYSQVVHRGKQHCTRVPAEHAFASIDCCWSTPRMAMWVHHKG